MTNEEVKELRLDMGLTQTEMGNLVGVDYHTIGHWEKGTQRPSELSERALQQVANKFHGHKAGEAQPSK